MGSGEAGCGHNVHFVALVEQLCQFGLSIQESLFVVSSLRIGHDYVNILRNSLLHNINFTLLIL